MANGGTIHQTRLYIYSTKRCVVHPPENLTRALKIDYNTAVGMTLR